MTHIKNKSTRLFHAAATLVLCLIASAGLTAQNLKITGTVADADATAVIGANVVVKGIPIGTSTDVKGNYTLNNVPSGATLVVSFMGYKTVEIPVNNRTVIDITLSEDAQQIEAVEVVETGYGTARHIDLTGSVSSVSGKAVEGYQSSSVMEALSGQVAGVRITQIDGTPGAGFEVKVRGVGTVTGDASPMYVVDGFEVDHIDYLSNNDIQSINILKDASAAAIYGARAANGVVLVTTKSGQTGRAVVSYSGSATYREITKRLDVLSPYEFVRLQVERDPTTAGKYYKEGVDDLGDPYRYQKMDDYIGVGGVKWQDEVFKPTWSQSHNVSLSGGNKETKYTLSFSNFSEEGIFTNSSNEKTTAKLRINQQINKRINVDATINYVNTDQRGIGTSADQGRFNMLTQIIRARPTGGLELTDEQLLSSAIDPIELEEESNLAQVNPLIQALNTTNNKVSDLWQANLTVKINLHKNLVFRSAGTYMNNNAKTDLFYNDNTYQTFRKGSPHGRTTRLGSLRWANSNYLTYTLKKAKHRTEVLLGQEISYNRAHSLIGESQNFPFDDLGNYNLALGALPSVVATPYNEKMLLSFFSRVNYNYDDRYLLTATVRADGSSAFKNHVWGYFPSFSVAWRISEEDFMKNVSFISSLKLRAGWGIVGNDRIASYLSSNLYANKAYGLGSQTVTVLDSKQLPSDVKWEGSETTDVGLDIRLFRNRLGITVDAFVKNTKDLLLAKTLSGTTGFTSQMQNIGKVRNKGLEFTVNTTNINTKNFVWNTDFNISFIRNKLIALQSGENRLYSQANFDSGFAANDYVAMIGRSIGSMYGFVFDGVYQSSDFNVNANTGAYELKPGVTDISTHSGKELKPGYVKYKDMDGDGKITDADRTVIGNGLPKWYGGIGNSMKYRNVDLSFRFEFSYGNDIYNATRMFNTQSALIRYNMLSEVADRWTATNSSNEVPSRDGYVVGDVYSRFIEDGSYLRMKEVTVGYSFPTRWIHKLHLSRLRVYVSAQNLFVVTNYSGFDPEVSLRSSNPMTPGVDWGAYPKSRVITGGIDLQF